MDGRRNELLTQTSRHPHFAMQSRSETSPHHACGKARHRSDCKQVSSSVEQNNSIIDLRHNQTGALKAQAPFTSFVKSEPSCWASPARSPRRDGFFLHTTAQVGLRRISETSQSDELHQRSVCPCEHKKEPESADDERRHQYGSLESLLQCQLPSDGNLEEDYAKNDAVAHHCPASTRRMLAMLHGIKQLVLVYKLADDEVCQACEKDLPGVPQNTVHHAYDKNEDCLRQEEPVAEDRGLDQLCVI
jgi:hypothetical protein